MNKKDWWIFLEYLEFGFGINEESFDVVVGLLSKRPNCYVRNGHSDFLIN